MLSSFLYITVEFLVFFIINFMIFLSLLRKVHARFQTLEDLRTEKEKTAQKLKKKLYYKQELLFEKKKELLLQEALLNCKKEEFEKYYTSKEIEGKNQLKTDLEDFRKNCFKEIDPTWKEKIKQVILEKLLELK